MPTTAQINSVLADTARREGLSLDSATLETLTQIVEGNLAGQVETHPAPGVNHDRVVRVLGHAANRNGFSVPMGTLDNIAADVEDYLVQQGILRGATPTQQPAAAEDGNLQALRERLAARTTEPEAKTVDLDVAYEAVRDHLRSGGFAYGVRLLGANLNDLTEQTVAFLNERGLLGG